MRRRDCLTLMAGATMVPFGAASHGSTDWQAWKARFLSAEGRVIDALQDDASHSEGQGYGMLLAALEGDAPAFTAMHAWTERHLAVRRDPLLAWRWLPRADPHVQDYKNASDGDLFYAWALLEGAMRFDVPAYSDRAEAIAGALVATCIRPDPRNEAARLFLPGAEDFGDAQRRVVNPSYIMPRAMEALAAAFNLPELLRAAADGVALIASLAGEGLVPDWVEIDGAGIRPARDFAPHSGYDALRVPLFMVWAGRGNHPAVERAAAAFRRFAGQETATVLSLDGSVLHRSHFAGYATLAALATCSVHGGARLPRFDAIQPYYPATLQLLALHAARTEAQHCLPSSR